MRVPCLIGVFLLAGCGGSSDPAPDDGASAKKEVGAVTPKPPEPTEPAQADVLVRGRAAWDNGKCMLCHGADGTGGQLGPSLTEGPWQHTDGTVASIVALLRTGIAKDKFENPAYPMPMEPATKLVSESELEALAEYVRSLRG